MPNVCHVICDTWHVQNPWIFICQPFKPAKLKQLKPSDSTDAMLLQYWTASNYTVNYLDPDNIALVPALVWTRDNQMNVFRLCVDVITNWSWSSVPPLHPAWISIQYSTHMVYAKKHILSGFTALLICWKLGILYLIHCCGWDSTATHSPQLRRGIRSFEAGPLPCLTAGRGIWPPRTAATICYRTATLSRQLMIASETSPSEAKWDMVVAMLHVNPVVVTPVDQCQLIVVLLLPAPLLFLSPRRVHIKSMLFRKSMWCPLHCSTGGCKPNGK